MNFLNVGPWELTVILVIAILVVGPKRMVEIVRAIGQTVSQMRRLSGEFLGAITSEIQAAEQETRESLESIAAGTRETIGSIPDEVQATEQEARQALEEAGEEQRGTTRSIKGEIETIERETVDVMKEIAENVEGIVRGEPGATEGQEETSSAQ